MGPQCTSFTVRIMCQKFKYRRQFLLSSAHITLLADWKYLQIGQYHLHAHPDLEVNRAADQTKSLVLIGSIFDPAKPEHENADILKEILT